MSTTPSPPSQINVSTKNPDFELYQLQRPMKEAGNLTQVGGRSGLEEHLGELATAGARIDSPSRTLDLIAHSQPTTCLLVFGDWVVADDDTCRAFCTAIAPAVEALKLERLRLIGCQTAVTPAGRQTLIAMSQNLPGVSVEGTSGIIYDFHFNQNGFNAETISVAQLQPVGAMGTMRSLLGPVVESMADAMKRSMQQAPAVREPFELDKLPRVAREDLEVVPWPLHLLDHASEPARIVEQAVDAGSGRAPTGLLTLPLLELLIPMEETWVRAQVLFDWRFIRVYPSGSQKECGRVYSVRDPAALHSLVTSRLGLG